MAAVTAEDFVKDIYANSDNKNQDGRPQYVFDSKKEVEMKRLDEQHYALLELQKDRLVHAPLDRPKRILDIGCGTGTTTVSIARRFPEAEVIGLDINPVPAMLNKPKNVTFIQGRVEDIIAGVSSTQASQPQSAPLDSSSFCAGSFDYIFARLLTCVISTWPELITTCTSLLASGGWLEMHEPAAYELYTERSHGRPLRTLANYSWNWTEVLYERSSALGYNMLIGKELHNYFLEQGLNEVSSVHYPWVSFPWRARPETERLGKYMQKYGKPGHPAILRMFTPNASNEEREDWEKQISEMCDDEQGEEGLHWRWYIVCGRKA